MINLNIKNETSTLKAVVLGTAKSYGPVPKPEECYDPKSREHVLSGKYPLEKDMVNELEAFNKVLLKYGITVYRPELVDNYNQIFARDIGFVIDDKFIKSNIIPNRDKELQAINYLIEQLNPENVITLPEDAHVEGGDIMPWNDYLFIGTYTAPDYPNYITARTNKKAVDLITDLFPNKKVKAFELRKSNDIARENALHLDCCFQPLDNGKAIIHKNGFLNISDYEFLINLFGKENVFEITKDEMYYMNSNIFSISENVVVSERNFTRLNNWLESKGFIVEKIPFAEIAKQEGLLRCSTLPLIRE